jgi:hypothetical protein
MNLLESLKRDTTVVADTGDIDVIVRYKSQDATTNPSLLYQAAQKPQYEHLVEEALHYASQFPGDRAAGTEAFMDRLFVNFGCEILRDCPRPGLNRSGCQTQLRRRRDTRQGAPAHRSLQTGTARSARVASARTVRPGKPKAPPRDAQGGMPFDDELRF